MKIIDDVERKVRKIIAEHLGKNEIEIKNEDSLICDDKDANLADRLLDTIELAMAMEKK